MGKAVFILSLALLVVIVLYWRTCHSVPIPSPSKSDSIVARNEEKAAKDTVINKKFVDSVNKDNTVLRKQNDSLRTVLSMSVGQLKGKDKDIQKLITAINEAEAKGDNNAALLACDSLKAAYPIAKGLVTQYIHANDSLLKVNDLISKNKDTIIGRLSSAYNEANSMLFETSRQYGIVSDNYKKALKQSGKRWSIGPVGGIGLAGSKGGPFLGIGLQFSLFKF